MSVNVKTRPSADDPWEFVGWGTAERIVDLDASDAANVPSEHSKALLGPWSATAICGNDITSSCLYVSAICALQAGRLAPVALALVAGLLYIFRAVYGEVGSALPLNGGAYNVLLNTTTKAKASVAACLTILSYIATAVISANEGMHYAHNLWAGLDVFGATIVLLGLFAFLNIVGIAESAIVALGIFVLHITTLTVLVFVSARTVLHDPMLFFSNWSAPPPGGFAKALFFGFSAGLLGISGFESSANFIEEQGPGVFPKTLRNMWIAVAIFNPVISLLMLGVLPIHAVGQHKEDLLAHMGGVVQGNILRNWVSIDAVLVLSGAVLTSYVGVTGLVRRMSLDRCLPQILLRENRWRQTNHYIIGGFFLLCCSILAITQGRVDVLAGVYTISFLGVMALFAAGNMLLKVKRARLPRDIRASWVAVVVGLVAVTAGLIGNVLLNPEYVKVFAIYAFVAIAVVALMFLRIEIMRILLMVSSAFVERIQKINSWFHNSIVQQMERINSLSVIYFTRGDNLAALNRAAQYVLNNEQTHRLIVVHIYKQEDGIPTDLAEHLQTLDHVYPHLRIDFIAVQGVFGPACIEALSKRLGVPRNYMFIGTPGDHFPHRISELGGVRLIM